MVVIVTRDAVAIAVLCFVRDQVPVPHGLMARVSLTRVRRAHHGDVGRAGIVRLDVALQLVEERVMRLSRVGERLRPVCLWHRRIMPTLSS